MGFNKPTDSWQHVTNQQAQNYFWNFYFLWWFYLWEWHRFVVSEHIKFIAEYNDHNNYFLGRSIFRSVQQYNDTDELDKNWWNGYVGKFNEDKTEIHIIASMPSITDTEFRQLYKLYGGKSNF